MQSKTLLIAFLILGSLFLIGLYLYKFYFRVEPGGGQPKENPESISKIELEVCKSPSGKEMNLAVARQLAFENCEDGYLKAGSSCDEKNGLWLIDFNPEVQKSGCSAVCMVDIETEKVEVKWNCSGD